MGGGMGGCGSGPGVGFGRGGEIGGKEGGSTTGGPGLSINLVAKLERFCTFVSMPRSERRFPSACPLPISSRSRQRGAGITRI